MQLARFKQRIFEIIEKGKDDDRASKVFDMFIIFLIFVNVFSRDCEVLSVNSVGCGKKF